jgi:hypothetical protein
MVGMCLPGTASAQSPGETRRWSFDFGSGWDNSISGNINSSAVGVINGPTVVVLSTPYEDVYGTGLHLRFGGGYMVDDATEFRGTFTFQSLDADLARIGDIGSSALYAQYDDYQSFGFDFGLRRYGNIAGQLKPYGEGSIGIGFIDETDVLLIVPGQNLTFDATDFYDKTTSFSFGFGGGVLWQVLSQVGVYGQIGIRFTTGMSEVDRFIGTGLDDINDDSARWVIPFTFGMRAKF